MGHRRICSTRKNVGQIRFWSRRHFVHLRRHQLKQVTFTERVYDSPTNVILLNNVTSKDSLKISGQVFALMPCTADGAKISKFCRGNFSPYFWQLIIWPFDFWPFVAAYNKNRQLFLLSNPPNTIFMLQFRKSGGLAQILPESQCRKRQITDAMLGKISTNLK